MFLFVQIHIELDKMRIIEFNDIKFTVSVSMFLAVHWLENRLQGPPPSPTAPYQAVEAKFIKHLWVPDIYIYHLEGINRVLQDFKGRLFVVNGREIYFRQEVVINLWCPMRFQFYPLDKQGCMFRIGSYQYPLGKMMFHISNMEQDLSRPNTLLEYTRMEELEDQEKLFVSKEKGNFSVAGFRLEFKRRAFKFIVNYYLPAGIFVLVSWSSFLIPPDLIPGRMNLLVALFLVLINIFNSVARTIPNTQGVNVLVAYLLICIFFIFGAMCGYSGILFIRNRRLRKIGGMIETTPLTSTRPSLTVSVIGALIGPVFMGSDHQLRQLAATANMNHAVGSSPGGPRGRSEMSLSTSRSPLVSEAPDPTQLPLHKDSRDKTGETAPPPGQPKNRGPWATRHEFAHIDNIFLIAFPTVFAVFNIMYWSICLHQLDHDVEEDQIILH